MLVHIDLQNTIDSKRLPEISKIQTWLTITLKKIDVVVEQPEVTIRVVSIEESQQLNLAYREKDKPTNILSFPFEAPEMIPIQELGGFLGDLVVCEQIVIDEANLQNKSLESHWAHMLVHGVLHLKGFDHVDEKDAEQMEMIEVKILNELGYSNPY